MKVYCFLIIVLIVVTVGIVSAEPPKCDLVVKPTEGIAPLTVMASEGSGDVTIVDWAWDFGDGNRAWKEPQIEHIYENAGEYKLTVTVINDKGEETSQEQIVTVEPTQILEETAIPVRVVYQGSTAIRDSLVSKSPTDSTNSLLLTATSEALKDVTYPYDILSSKIEDTKTVVTVFKIQKSRCDTKSEVCGYWITATRDGQEVATNSPIWISPPPYIATVSEVYDAIANEKVVTIKEDPKLAVEQILQEYVDGQPLGRATVGTKI